MTASTLQSSYHQQVADRIDRIDAMARQGGLDAAVELLADCVEADGVVQAFGSGHSECFAMEIATRAGGLIPTHACKAVDLVLAGLWDLASFERPQFERQSEAGDALYDLYDIRAADVFLIASNSGVNGMIVGLALRAKAEGHPVIAVTSLEHTRRATPGHPSGKRLAEVADVVIDNLAPYGDTTLPVDSQVKTGAVSSITAAYIAQLLTIGVVDRFLWRGQTPPLYISANVPGGIERNQACENRYEGRLRPYARLSRLSQASARP
ncbi:MAG: SIS domain-containing protein [Bifidobacteriaceae bacterium]|jgi:uncharacterized phosphosugar-binding protein|nr:SIS domain-containing protein [Bifidobacteriaceae bacterium]